MDIDTGLLRALVVLADELHFGRAATRLGITQQAVSKRLRRLEDQLGAVLVDRSDRHEIRLTAAGRRAVTPAREVLAVVDRLGAAAGADGGRLRIDVMGDDLAASDWVLRAARTGGLPLDAVHRPAGAAAEHLLLSGGADLALGRCGAVPSPWPSGIRHRPLLMEPLAVLVADGHPWAGLDELPLSELAGQRLWFPMAAAPAEWRSFLTELCTVADIDLDTAGSTHGYRRWVEDVSTGSARPTFIGGAMRLPDPRTRTVPVVDPVPVFPWSLLWRDDLPTSSLGLVLAGMGFSAPAPPPGAGVWMPEEDEAFVRAR